MAETCREKCFSSEENREGMAQSAMRYNDQSAFYANQSQGIFLNLQQQYNSSAVSRLDYGPYRNVPGAPPAG